MRRRRKDDNAAQVKRRSTAKSKHFIYLERVLACRSARAGPGASPVQAERSSVDSAAFNEPERQTPNLPPASAPPPSQSPQPSVEPPSPPIGGHAQTRSLCPAQPQKIRANSGNRVDSTPRGSGVEDSSLARQAISPTQFFANYTLPNFPVTHFLSSAMKKENPRRGLLGISRKCAKLISP